MRRWHPILFLCLALGLYWLCHEGRHESTIMTSDEAGTPTSFLLIDPGMESTETPQPVAETEAEPESPHETLADASAETDPVEIDRSEDEGAFDEARTLALLELQKHLQKRVLDEPDLDLGTLAPGMVLLEFAPWDEWSTDDYVFYKIRSVQVEGGTEPGSALEGIVWSFDLIPLMVHFPPEDVPPRRAGRFTSTLSVTLPTSG